jgi:hypothetical protein
MMAKRGKSRKPAPVAPAPSDAAPAPDYANIGADDQISVSNLSLHQLFEQQAREMLDRADMDEEQKQSILVAMSCPCCGAGGLSYTVKLKR